MSCEVHRRRSGRDAGRPISASRPAHWTTMAATSHSTRKVVLPSAARPAANCRRRSVRRRGGAPYRSEPAALWRRALGHPDQHPRAGVVMGRGPDASSAVTFARPGGGQIGTTRTAAGLQTIAMSAGSLLSTTISVEGRLRTAAPRWGATLTPVAATMEAATSAVARSSGWSCTRKRFSAAELACERSQHAASGGPSRRHAVGSPPSGC